MIHHEVYKNTPKTNFVHTSVTSIESKLLCIQCPTPVASALKVPPCRRAIWEEAVTLFTGCRVHNSIGIFHMLACWGRPTANWFYVRHKKVFSFFLMLNLGYFAQWWSRGGCYDVCWELKGYVRVRVGLLKPDFIRALLWLNFTEVADEFSISKNTHNANFTNMWLKQAF